MNMVVFQIILLCQPFKKVNIIISNLLIKKLKRPRKPCIEANQAGVGVGSEINLCFTVRSLNLSLSPGVLRILN